MKERISGLLMLVAVAVIVVGCEGDNHNYDIVATNEVNNLPGVTVNVGGSNNTVDVTLPRPPEDAPDHPMQWDGMPDGGGNEPESAGAPGHYDVDVSVGGVGNSVVIKRRALLEMRRQKAEIEAKGI